MTPQRARLLARLGLAPLWRLRQPADDGAEGEGDVEPAQAPAVVTGSTGALLLPANERAEPDQPALPARQDAGGADWEALELEIRGCAACPLHRQRTQAVPGIGDRHPSWLVVGEGPGAEEDRRGEPFVGPAGQLLDAMLAAVGLSRREGVFIANAVKCRPPGNRTPEADEIASCFPYLRRQVRLLAPRLIVAVGRPAAQALLDQPVRIADARGRVFEFEGIPVIVTYHPAYLLRNPQDKGKAWEDLCRARAMTHPPAGASH
ncbi:MAG: uracil-DNA glycosylase [Rhodocyclaceae bacterium]|nr:uracil-DNA glycosylase [Rhodocyclaceae bacterium]